MRRVTMVMVGLGLIVVSCGTGSDNKVLSSVTVVAQKAPEATQAAETAKTTFTISGLGAGSAPDVSADGAFDLTRGRGVIMADLPAIAGVQLGKAEAIVDGGTLYFKVPDLLAEQVDKKWVKLDVGEASKKIADVDISGLARAGTGNPTYALDNLRGATEVTVVGDERVRGEKTTHYRATIDTNKAIGELPADERDALKKANDFLGNQTIPADIWLDGEHRLRKLQYSIDPSMTLVPASNGAQKPTFTYELYEFGTKVDATIPPKGETVDLAEVLPR